MKKPTRSEPFRPAAGRPAWRSLTFQLFSFVIIPLVAVLLLITFGSVTLHENAMRDLVGERDERAAKMAARAISEQLHTRANLLVWFAGQDRQAGLAAADGLVGSFDHGIAWIDGSGLQGALAGPPPAEIRAGWQSLTVDRGAGFVVTQAFQTAEDGPFLAAILAANPDRTGAVVGIFTVAGLAQQSLAALLDAGQEVTIWLVDPQGQVLYHAGSSLHNDRSAGQDAHTNYPRIEPALAGNSGRQFVRVDGMEHVVAYSPVAEPGWVLLIEEPWQHVASPQLQITQMAPLVMVPVAILALVGLVFGIRQIVQPLQSLARQSAQLGWGDYAAIEQPAGGIDEIRQLQTELIHMARKVQSAQDSLHSYIGAITAGQEEERRRLARELHDETIQTLIALKQRMQLAQMDLGSQSAAGALKEMEEAAESAIAEVRRMVRALRPIYLEDLGLAAALNMLANETGRELGIPVGFERLGEERRLDGPVELSLFRIAQEALNNIARHAQATRALVRIEFGPAETRLTIEDDGQGFQVSKSPSAFAEGGHFGLLGMYERAELLKARLQIDSQPGQGTTVSVRVVV